MTPRPAVAASWAESYAAAYVTTEVWAHFDRVWVQPMYVPIIGWMADGTPNRVADANGDWHPIFSVGPTSRFYSPFWQLIYVQVPEGTPDGQLTSVTQVLDGHYPLFPASSWVAASCICMCSIESYMLTWTFWPSPVRSRAISASRMPWHRCMPVV